MKIKVAATSESRGSRNAGGRSSSGSNAAAVITVSIVITVTAMFAARLVTVQQALVKAGTVPRLYNALITTDQKLLPSQTEPLVRTVLTTFGGYTYEWLGPYAAPVYAQAASAYAQDGTAPHVQAYATQDGTAPHVQAYATQDGSDYARTGTSADGVPPSRPVDDGVDERKAPPSIKNNRPVDPSVPDVPPPPIPVGAGKKNKKKPEEYPPPPVGFTI